MQKSKFIAASFLFVVLFLSISGCAGVSRIESFLQNQEYKEHGKIIDFAIFFTIFFAISYLGLTKVWGTGYGQAPAQAKGAIVGLCIALALALSFAIVTQVHFSLTSLFPLAKAMFFIVIWFLLWGLLNKAKVFGEDHWSAKIINAIMAGIIVYILASISTHMLCQMTDNMNDPACRSEFFNFGSTMLVRMADVTVSAFSKWTKYDPNWDGSISPVQEWQQGPQGYPSGGFQSGGFQSGGFQSGGFQSGGAQSGTQQGSTQSGSTQTPSDSSGNCRLDITFQVNSVNIVSGGNAIPDLVKRAKAKGIKKLTVYGYASKEGDEKNNRMLANNRAKAIGAAITQVDKDMSVTLHGYGATDMFGSQYEPNRRAVITAGGSVTPAPEAGQIVNCEVTEEAKSTVTKEEEAKVSACGNGKLDLGIGEVCDPTTSMTQCRDNQECSDECKCVSKSKSNKLLWAIIGILLLLISYLCFRQARKYTVKVKDVIGKKDAFVMTLNKSKETQTRSYDRLKTELTASRSDTYNVNAKAQQLIANLENQLANNSWCKSIKKLAEFMEKKNKQTLTEIATFKNNFRVDPHDFDLIKHLIDQMKAKHGKNESNWASKMKDDDFKKNLEAVTVEHLQGRKFAHELHEFTRVLKDLRKHAQKFLGNEQTVLVKLSHGTKKDIKETEESIDEHSSRFSLVDVTEDVAVLTKRLISRIDELLRQEATLNDRALIWQAFDDAFKYEIRTIEKLIHRISIQKELMAVEWQPVIDNIDISNRQFAGHIHMKRHDNLNGTEEAFYYQWCMVDSEDDFQQLRHHKLGPYTLERMKNGRKLADHSAGYGINTKLTKDCPLPKPSEATFIDVDKVISDPSSEGKVIALGACRIKELPPGVKQEIAVGFWKWDGKKIPVKTPKPPVEQASKPEKVPVQQFPKKPEQKETKPKQPAPKFLPNIWAADESPGKKGSTRMRRLLQNDFSRYPDFKFFITKPDGAFQARASIRKKTGQMHVVDAPDLDWEVTITCVEGGKPVTYQSGKHAVPLPADNETNINLIFRCHPGAKPGETYYAHVELLQNKKIINENHIDFVIDTPSGGSKQ